MDLGDAAGWAAFAISVGAFSVSVRAQRDGRRSANAAEKSATTSEKSATAAEASVEEARLSREEARLSRLASERSATVAEQQLADQRQEAAERRAAEEEANRPRPEFRIERSGQQAFRLRNIGTGPATGIRVSDRALPYILNGLDDVALTAGDAQPFMMVGAAGRPVPGTLYLTWDGQSDEVPVAVPGV
ncbi:hypothetical protein ACWCQM_11120 [Streptomyces sp. NPDC002125]